MNISKRLEKVASFVSTGNSLADIGTDHGYVPIYLVMNGKIPSAIAMDINEGPLKRAYNNISTYRLEEKIETRLSDGLEKLQVGEVDTILIAGMGGTLEVAIMESHIKVLHSAKEIILSPHSDLQLVRKFLKDNMFNIVEEEMIIDEGKYYTIMRVIPGKMISYTEAEYEYGKLLIEGRSQVLREYLQNEHKSYSNILHNLDSDSIRFKEIYRMISMIEQILRCYE